MLVSVSVWVDAGCDGPGWCEFCQFVSVGNMSHRDFLGFGSFIFLSFVDVFVEDELVVDFSYGVFVCVEEPEAVSKRSLWARDRVSGRALC